MTDAAEGPDAGDGPADGGGDGPADGGELAASADDDGPDGRVLRRRIVEQFSGAGERAAAWRALDRVLPTGEYLNLGYSPWYLPVVVGDSQARLAAHLADGLADRLGSPAGVRLLDLGCGRGGPARQFADRGFAVTGLDLVPHNVALARANAERAGFAVGDATALPFVDDAFGACVAVDSLVYVPDGRAPFEEAARVLEPGGWLAVSDLLARADTGLVRGDGRLACEGTGPGTAAVLAAFADAWDLASPVSADAYHDRLRAAGFAVESVEDVTANSVGRFRKWSGAFLALADGPTGGVLRALLRGWGADPEAVVGRVRAAHRALAHLRHEVVYARL